MATPWLWAITFANRERQRGVKADKTQASSVSNNAAGLDVYLLATAPSSVQDAGLMVG